VETWLTRLSGSSAFERLWRPLLRAKLGEAWKESSAAFIWATIQRLYAARQAGLKKEMFGYVPGGYRTVVDRFRAKLEEKGVGIRLNARIEKVRTEGGQVHLEGTTGGAYDRTVLTVTPRVAGRLCEDLLESERASLDSVKYQGVVCASMLLDEKLADYYLTYLTDDWVPFTAVVEMTAFISTAETAGRHLVYLPKYAAADAPVFSQSEDELRTSYVAALERIYPHFEASQVRAFRVSRVREVFPLPTLGYSKNLPPTSFQRMPGVIAISSAHIQNGTLNVNDTVKVAERAAKSLVLQKGRRLFLD
jgi:protoporphyrinogen oxidase